MRISIVSQPFILECDHYRGHTTPLEVGLSLYSSVGRQLFGFVCVAKDRSRYRSMSLVSIGESK
jgi:hypothetical protein